MENLENNLSYYESLIVKYLANNISGEELEELQSWINESTQNKEAFHQFKASWLLAGMSDNSKEFDSEQAYNAIKPKMDIYAETHTLTEKSFHILANIRKYAAVGLICFGMGGFIVWLLTANHNRINLAGTTISAPFGAKSVIDLPDGTKVWLNAGSKLKYEDNYGQVNRTVILTGEAYFNVAKNKEVPFLVKTSKIMIRALGTRFNVKAYPDEQTITTILEEGKIEVTTIDKTQQQQRIILNPKERIVYYMDVNQLKKEIASIPEHSAEENHHEGIPNAIVSDNVKTILYTSWKDNKWILEGISLGSLGTMMERRYNVNIIFNDPAIREYKFTGTIENQTLEQILNAFKFTAPVGYKIDKNTVYLNLNAAEAEKFKKITDEK